METHSRSRTRVARFLLLIPFIAVMWVPFYNRTEPMLFDIPFFYWYQLIWIPLTAVVISAVYWLEASDTAPQSRPEQRP